MNESISVSVQQDHADDPVELARRLVRAVVEDAAHVQEHGEHHEVRAPSMHVAHERAEPHRGLELLHVAPRERFGRPVEEHQEDAGDGEQDEQEEAQPAEAERVADLHRVPLHLHRVQVVQHVVHDHVGAVPGAVGVALPEDRPRPEDRRHHLRVADACRRASCCARAASRRCRRCRSRCSRCRWPRVPSPCVWWCQHGRAGWTRTGRRTRSRAGWCGCGGRPRRPAGRACRG